jgi:hypothetical protein
VVVAYHAGDRSIIFPLVGAAACFLMRMAGLRYGIGLPRAADVAVTGMPHGRRVHAVEDNSGNKDRQQAPNEPSGAQSTVKLPKR